MPLRRLSRLARRLSINPAPIADPWVWDPAREREFERYRFARVLPAIRFIAIVLCPALLISAGLQAPIHMMSLISVGAAPVVLLLSIRWLSYRPIFEEHWQPLIVATTIGYGLFYVGMFPIPDLSDRSTVESSLRAYMFDEITMSMFVIGVVGLSLTQVAARWLIFGGLSLATIAVGYSISFGVAVVPAIRHGCFYWSLFLLPLYLLAGALERSRRSEFVYQQLLLQEQEKSERLLFNMLPQQTIPRMKTGVYPIADRRSDVGILFADIAGFTTWAAASTPDDVVRMLDELFRTFDHLAARHRVEKIKTIGDCYMACTGVGDAEHTPLKALGHLALEIAQAMATIRSTRNLDLQIRIGINVGPAVAGVIGQQRLAFDLWGHAVNVASRMESSGAPGRIHVSSDARALMAENFVFSPAREVDLKHLGSATTYWLLEARR